VMFLHQRAQARKLLGLLAFQPGGEDRAVVSLDLLPDDLRPR